MIGHKGEMKEVVWKDQLCEEASMFSKEKYIPCGSIATFVIYHRKDNRSYFMCTLCAFHNVTNRGGKILFKKE